MATLRQIYFNIMNIIRGGRQSDDELISERQMTFMVNYYRGMLIRQDYEKKRNINPDIVQDLKCVPVVLVDKADCCEIVTDCYILRTETPIPKTIEFYYNNALMYVGGVDKVHPFQISSIYESTWASGNRLTGSLEKAYLLNGYVYITSNTVLKHVNIRGIFEDPITAMEYNACNNHYTCEPYEEPYPVSASMIPIITQMIMEKELRLVLTPRSDYVGNAKEDEKN